MGKVGSVLQRKSLFLCQKRKVATVKKTIYFLLLTAAFVISCKKYQEQKDIGNHIIGTWELEHFYGFPETRAYPPGNGITLSFLKGFVFESKRHDTLLARGIYSIERKKDCHPSDREIKLKMVSNDGLASDNYVDIENGKLSLSTPNCYMDGGMNVWRRL